MKSKLEKIRHSVLNNPLKTEKQIFRFKKQVINAVDDYLKYILSDISKMYKQLQRKTKIK